MADLAILDTSVVIAWAFPEEQTGVVRRLVERLYLEEWKTFAAPPLYVSELANAIRQKVVSRQAEAIELFYLIRRAIPVEIREPGNL